ncbi:hypothetical protein ACA545_13680 [Vibrio cholerae]|uniref:hypothetical protein n=1 Tax=Vibrio cholerae TaxID=666 RepID=UPI00208D81FD|nr:hypothetical protein [Vibrio cholerae]GHZ24611.1 transposase [Vibrio cholerae]
MFRINEVLEFEKERFRILSRFGDNFVWISIDNKSAFPSIIDLYSLDLAIQDESLHRVEDPYSYLIMLSPEDDSTAQVKRDQNYKLISPIIHLEEYYQPKQRAKAIDLVMVNHKTTNQTNIVSPNSPILAAGADCKRASSRLQKFRRKRQKAHSRQNKVRAAKKV